MRGYPSWPGKIVLPPDELKRPCIKKLLHCVQFFGTHDFSWILEQDVKAYEKFRDKMIGGSKTIGFRKAIQEVDEFIVSKRIINQITHPIASSSKLPEEISSKMTASKNEVPDEAVVNEVVDKAQYSN